MESLAPQQRQAPSPVDTGSPVAVNAGVTGATQNPDLSVNPIQTRPVGRLLDGLVKLGGELIKPAVKRQNDALFFEGMSRAAAGEAAKTIADESPAWSNFFGEGAGALGARAYEGARDASQMEGDAIANMAQDRRATPEQYAQTLRKRLEGMQTDDPLRTQQMQAAAMQMLPGMMKVHAQAHVQFNQEQAFQARSAAVGAAINAIEEHDRASRAGNVPMTKEDRLRVRDTFLLTMGTIPGEDPRIADKAKVANLLAAMAEGKMAAYETLQDSGALDALPIEQRDQLARTYKVEANRALPGRVLPATRDLHVALLLNPPLDGAALDEQVNAINSRASIESGIMGADLISPEDRVRLLVSAAGRERATQAAQSKRAATAADAEAKEAALQAGARAALTDNRGQQGGAAAWAAVIGDGGARAIQQQGTVLWRELSQPQTRAALLTNLGTGSTLTVAKGEFATAANAADWSPQVALTAATLKLLPPEVQGAYGVTADQHFLFSQAEQNIKGSLPPQDAWKAAKSALLLKPFQNPTMSKEDREAVADVAKTFNTSPWGRNRTDAQGFALLEGMVGAGMASAPGGTPEARAMGARGSVTARGGETVGNVFFFRAGKDLENWRQSLHGGNGAGEEQVAEAFQAIWARKLRVNSGLDEQTTWPMGKLKPTLPWVTMQKDSRGDFYWSSIYHDPDADGIQGRMHHVSISKKDIEAELRKQSEAFDVATRNKPTAGMSDFVAP